MGRCRLGGIGFLRRVLREFSGELGGLGCFLRFLGGLVGSRGSGGGGDGRRWGGGRRGVVMGFSRRAKARFARFVGSLPVPAFGFLTISKPVGMDVDEFLDIVRWFDRRLREVLGRHGGFAVKKDEIGRGGVVHFHYLLYVVDWERYSGSVYWYNQLWIDVTDLLEELGFWVDVDVRPIVRGRDYFRCADYLLKDDASKRYPELRRKLGSVWSVINRKNVPKERLEFRFSFGDDEKAYYMFRRVLERYARSRKKLRRSLRRNGYGFSLWGSGYLDVVMRLLMEYCPGIDRYVLEQRDVLERLYSLYGMEVPGFIRRVWEGGRGGGDGGVVSKVFL